MAGGRRLLSDWRWMPFYFQRRFRSEANRKAGARLLAGLRPAPAFPTGEADPLLAPLLSEGQASLGQVFTAAQCEEIRGWLMARKVSDENRPEVAPWQPLGEGRHPHSHVGYHQAEDVVRAPHLLALANRPELLATAERFLGCRPTIGYLAAWWSYATPIGAQQAENFHRDVDDWRFVKFFVYLTDVDEDKGPHIYVRHSALTPATGPIRRYTDEEVRDAFPAEDILTMTGPAGSAFLEDTYGMHKGQPLKHGHRLMFQAVYSIMPLPYGPKRPVIRRGEAEAVAGMALDPFVNRIYVSRRS